MYICTIHVHVTPELACRCYGCCLWWWRWWWCWWWSNRNDAGTRRLRSSSSYSVNLFLEETLMQLCVHDQCEIKKLSITISVLLFYSIFLYIIMHATPVTRYQITLDWDWCKQPFIARVGSLAISGLAAVRSSTGSRLGVPMAVTCRSLFTRNLPGLNLVQCFYESFNDISSMFVLWSVIIFIFK